MEMRRARSDDWLAIETLSRGARRALPKLWWWEEYLAEDLFVVVEQIGVVVGALFAWADDSPVAWVRLAVLSDALTVAEWLDLVLLPVLDRLRRRGMRKLAWMDCQSWAGPQLKRRGFKPLTEVVTLIKSDRDLPGGRITEAYVRSVSDVDIPAVVAVDRAAFSPHWWYSEATVRRKMGVSAHFVVAELAREVVGYAEGELRSQVAHLNRIAVHPVHQGRGIGELLLRDALLAFWRDGAKQVSLNTQIDNQHSQRLYHHLGFEPTGEHTTVWELHL